MKKTRKFLSIAITIALFVGLLPMGSVNVSALEFEYVVGDFNYRFNSDTYTAVVKQYYGTATEVTVPSTVTNSGYTYTVTEMRDSFWNNETVTKVTISDGIKTIGTSAFQNCDTLTSVIIPSSVTTIARSAFRDNTGLTAFTIPSTVKTIGEGAFAYCTGLTAVTISNGVEEIAQSAFEGCVGLTSIVIPSSVTTIGKGAFRDNTGLTSITIPSSVKTIGQFAFTNCTGLTSVTISEGVEEIGKDAFRECTGLTSVVIPDSVILIDEGAFWECTGLESVTIPEGVTTIGHSAFRGCTGLTSVTIPGSVTTIGQGAFSICTGLESVVISDGVEEIVQDAFYGCTGLTSITIPDSVTTIGEYAFGDCSSLAEVTIYYNATMPTIGDYAFGGTPAEANDNIKYIDTQGVVIAPYGLDHGVAELNSTSYSKEIEAQIGDVMQYQMSVTLPNVSNANFWKKCYFTFVMDYQWVEPKTVSIIVDGKAFEIDLASGEISYNGEHMGDFTLSDYRNKNKVMTVDLYGEKFVNEFSGKKMVFSLQTEVAPDAAEKAYNNATLDYELDNEVTKLSGQLIADVIEIDIHTHNNYKYDSTDTEHWSVCGECGEEIENSRAAHTYDQENTDTKYWVSNATCEESMLFKKSCICGAAGEETFEYGTPNRHIDHDGDGACDDCDTSSNTPTYSFCFDINLIFEFLKKLFSLIGGIFS